MHTTVTSYEQAEMSNLVLLKEKKTNPADPRVVPPVVTRGASAAAAEGTFRATLPAAVAAPSGVRWRRPAVLLLKMAAVVPSSPPPTASSPPPHPPQPLPHPAAGA